MPKCMFGLKCYRRNPNHFESFKHPHIDTLIEFQGNEIGIKDCLTKLVESGADEATLKDQVKRLYSFLRNSNNSHLWLKTHRFKSSLDLRLALCPLNCLSSKFPGETFRQ